MRHRTQFIRCARITLLIRLLLIVTYFISLSVVLEIFLSCSRNVNALHRTKLLVFRIRFVSFRTIYQSIYLRMFLKFSRRWSTQTLIEIVFRFHFFLLLLFAHFEFLSQKWVKRQIFQMSRELNRDQVTESVWLCVRDAMSTSTRKLKQSFPTYFKILDNSLPLRVTETEHSTPNEKKKQKYTKLMTWELLIFLLLLLLLLLLTANSTAIATGAAAIAVLVGAHFVFHTKLLLGIWRHKF